MSESKHLVKNIFSLVIVQVANYVLPLISIPIVVRVIGPDNFGIINYYSAFVAYFMLLINYGFDYSGTRVIAAEPYNIEKRNLHFTKILYAKLMLFLISIILFFISLTFISHSQTETKVAIYTFLIAVSWVITPNWFFQGMQELKKLALFNFLSKLIFNLMIIFLIVKKEHFIWQPLILSLSQIFVSIISLLYAIKKFGINLMKTSFSAVFRLLWIDKMIFFSMLATHLYTDTNIVILGFYETKEHIGYFTAAWRLTFVFLVLLSLPTSQALFPYIAASFSKSIEKGILQIRRILPIIIYASLGFSVVLFFFGGIIIRNFYGEGFQPAVVVFRILTIVPVLSFINTILGLQTMVNLKMDTSYFLILLSGGIFSVIFNIIIVRNYGYVGGAWSWILAEAVIAIVLNHYLKKKGYSMFIWKNFSPRAVIAEVEILVKNFKNRKNASLEN